MEDLFKNEIKDFRWCHFLVTMRGVDPGISLLGKQLFKGELHSNYIFLHFALIGLEWDSITPFQHYLHKIYMTFYLLTWT